MNARSNGSNATEQAAEALQEALRRRGFLTRVEGDRVVFSSGNGKRDYADVRRLLEAEGVPACYSGDAVQVLCPSLPRSIAADILRMPVRYGRAELPKGFHGWKAFTKRGHGARWNTLSLDRGIAYLVKALSEAGILVTGGCDGHGRAEPKVYLASDYAAMLERPTTRVAERLRRLAQPIGDRRHVFPNEPSAPSSLPVLNGSQSRTCVFRAFDDLPSIM
ncbi:hypothetical protein MO973_25115 [Paenibacillus sp. TRM 82003]|nr:hypothetical protein [Paenibacillus sp. TRM 82003]